MSRLVPSDVVAAMTLATEASLHRLPGRSGVWRVEENEGCFVLRRNEPVDDPEMSPTVAVDVGWVHRQLGGLAATGFPASQPLRRLDGESVGVFGGDVWETLTYLPGRVAGWSSRPAMGALGGFLAAYHHAAERLASGSQRALSYPVSAILTDSDAVASRLVSADREAFMNVCDELADGLAAIDHDHAAQSVIHGDFTHHNVIVAGSPVAPVGVIDFANAYVEATVADVAFAMWRSGRHRQDADTFDPRRVADYVAGYHAIRGLTEHDATAIVVYLRARGLQILAKQAHRQPDRPIDARPLIKLAAFSRIQSRLHDDIAAAIT